MSSDRFHAVAKRVLFVSSRYSFIADLFARGVMRFFSKLARYSRATLFNTFKCHLNTRDRTYSVGLIES